ncbi:MAG: RHS repeat-associated core domain-containing protein [Kineosporiaceae bacterium]
MHSLRRAGAAGVLVAGLLLVGQGPVASPAAAIEVPGPPAPRVTSVTQAGLNQELLTAQQTDADSLAAAEVAALREQDAAATTARAQEAGTGSRAAGRAAVSPMTAGAGNGGGDVTASPLSASAVWSGGGNSGAFTWSYPIRVPAPGAGPVPQLTVLYDSGSVDGRTSASNNQGSWLGEGFDLPTSFIERSYAGCRDDGHESSGDLCWKNDNANLVLNGKATALIRVSDSEWRLASDDGSKVQRRRDSGLANGAREGEHWVVTTTDGTQYWFGRQVLPGGTTNSVFTVPVFGDDAGEPCYDPTSFAASSCVQAWRWNLDYVVDLYGNASIYRYAQETNGYARNGAASTSVAYVRGGYLTRIEYGLRADALAAKAPYTVEFSVAERCTAGTTKCAALTSSSKGYWPDVPFEAICDLKDAGSRCTSSQKSPVFFSRKRLVGVTTKVWNATSASPAYQTVDSWAFTQTYLDPGDTGDTKDQSLWLKSLQQMNATTVAGQQVKILQPVSFLFRFLQNRVDRSSDGRLPLNKPRLIRVISETGQSTNITYSDPECPTTGRVEDNSLTRCFPMKWYPEGATAPVLDWFHKYVVTSVVETDPFGNSPALKTTYSYEGPAAWRYALDPITPVKQRTWSQWRGYSKVTTLTGDGSDGPQGKTVSVFMQGMDGDRRLSGTPRTVTVSGIKAPAIKDSDPFAGYLREQVTYNGKDGPEVSGTINTPWAQSTASQTFPATPTSTDFVARAWYIRTSSTQERVSLGGTPTRYRRALSTTTYDSTYGVPTRVDASTEVDPVTATTTPTPTPTPSASGTTTTGPERSCTRLWYARNPDIGLQNLLSRKQVLSVACSAASTAVLPQSETTTGDVISDTASGFAGATTWTANATPARPEATWTGRVKGYSGGNPVWQTLSTLTYDARGRLATTTDAAGAKSTSAYTPPVALPVTAATATNALGHTVSTAFDVRWGLPVSVRDATGRTAETQYDELGRVSAHWGINNTRRPNPNDPSVQSTPTAAYAYSVTRNAPAWVRTTAVTGGLNGSRITYQVYDGLLRLRQTQAPSPRGGTVLTVTQYDSRGQVRNEARDIYTTTSFPGGTLMATTMAPPAESTTTFDGAGRVVGNAFKVLGVQKWSTTTTYTGDSVATTAVTGGSASAVFTDAAGREIERRTYPGTVPTGATYLVTRKTYDRAGRVATIKGPDNAEWAYTYDLNGRVRSTADPDSGVSTTEYTATDQVAKTVDGRGKVVLSDYDLLGRKTAEYEGSRTDAGLAATWTYDTVRPGLPTGWTKYVGGKAGAAYTQAVTRYDALNMPQATVFTLPGTDPLVTEAKVPASWEFITRRNIDGSIAAVTSPSVGGLPGFSPTVTYSGLGLPTALSGLVADVKYSELGQVDWMSLSQNVNLSKQAAVSMRYEPGTGRLASVTAGEGGSAALALNLSYSYDLAGNVISVKDTAPSGGAAADTQCFTYDGYRRMTDAWTPGNADCNVTGRSAATLGGPAPFWLSWTYAAGGQRQTETQRTPSGGVSTTTYTYGSNLTAQPHTLRSTTTTVTGSMTGAVGGSAGPGAGSGAGTGGSAGSRAFTYDASGNMLTRQAATGGPVQTMTWDAWGRMASNSVPPAGSKPARSTSYVYAPDGSLLLRRPTNAGPGETVLYVGDIELHWTKPVSATTTPSPTGGSSPVGKVSATRRISFAGRTVAVQSATFGGATSLSYVLSDQQGTAFVAMDAVTMSVTRRYTTPFGTARGPRPSWIDDHGFLGKPEDADTGLTHVGAREYDPGLGRFISVDPVLDPADPQSFNGYTYGNNNPDAYPDPSGLSPSLCAYRPGTCGVSNAYNVPDRSLFERIGDKIGTAVSGYLSRHGTTAKDVLTRGPWDLKGQVAGGVNGAYDLGQGIIELPLQMKATSSDYDAAVAEGTHGLLESGQDWVNQKLGLSTSGPGYVYGRVGFETVLAVLPVVGGASKALNAARLAPRATELTEAATAARAVANGIAKEAESVAPRAAEGGASGARNVANGVRLRAQLAGREISGGHAFEKHVVERGEFPGIRTRSEFADVIEGVIPKGEMRPLSSGRSAYWRDGVVVIRNPRAADGGTAFVPKNGYDYFVGLT